MKPFYKVVKVKTTLGGTPQATETFFRSHKNAASFRKSLCDNAVENGYMPCKGKEGADVFRNGNYTEIEVQPIQVCTFTD